MNFNSWNRFPHLKYLCGILMQRECIEPNERVQITKGYVDGIIPFVIHRMPWKYRLVPTIKNFILE
jgi:hypothetical protein